MKRIGVLSDTHGKLREEVLEILRECDTILHAGDINTQRTLEKLREIAPVYVVRGNADGEWAAQLPECLSEEICGLRVFMVHNKRELPQDTVGYDLVVYGHSHKYEEKETAEGFFLNPGSCGPRRFSQPVTMAVLEVEEGGKFRVLRKDIVQGGTAAFGQSGETALGQSRNTAFGQSKETAEGKEETPEKVVAEKTLRAILRDVDRGKSVSEIAGKYGISQETAKQICRLYLTHPGIGAAGVREKMGLPRDR